MGSDELTARDQETLRVLRDYMSLYPFPPTVRELAKLLSVSSPSSAHERLNSLERKGYLRRRPGQARAYLLVEEDGW